MVTTTYDRTLTPPLWTGHPAPIHEFASDSASTRDSLLVGLSTVDSNSLDKATVKRTKAKALKEGFLTGMTTSLWSPWERKPTRKLK